MISLEAELARLRALIADPADWCVVFHCCLADTAHSFVRTQHHDAREYRVVESRGMYAVERRQRQ